MSGIDLLMSYLLGEKVLKTAVKIETAKMNKNSRTGNRKGVGKLINIDLWKLMDHPTIVPIRTPEKLLATTRMKAS